MLKHFIGLIFLLAIFLYAILLPGPKDLLRSLIIGHDTVYAPGFSERNFRRVQIGMTPEEVEATMGCPPIQVIDYPSKDKYYWEYSMSPGDTHHWMWTVSFNAGRVTRTSHGFYFD